jgi:hypothetical protein
MSTVAPAIIDAAIKFNDLRARDVLSDFRAALKVPGDAEHYDAALVERIVEEQAKAKLSADGKVGQHTRELLSSLQQALDASSLWPAPSASEAEKAEHYRGLLQKLQVDTALKRPLLAAFRGVALRGSGTHAVLSQAKYDDAFVLLVPVEGSVKVREFEGATHPYQRVTSLAAAPDVNKDGEADVGTIKPGSYLLRRQTKPAGHPSLHLVKLDGKDGIPTWRDTNHDGKISGPELDASLNQLATEVLLHPGFTSQLRSGNRNYSSIGCQTARVEDVQAVADHEQVDYALIDARAALQALGVS